jgi:ferritin-like metal-binding protein YciE
MAAHDLKDAFLAEMRDILDGETQILKGLRTMQQKASHEDLKEAFDEHLHQTKGQIDRLEQAFHSIDENPRGKHCAGIAGIIEEGEEMMEQAADPEVLDAMLIAGAQKVEHYEIATYGTLCTWAEQLGFEEAAELLKENLREEKETDEKLSELAQEVNLQAMTGG